MKQLSFACLFGILAASPIRLQAAPGDSASDSTWNSKSAASYLDGRAQWWTTWPKAARDHGTFCVSCHTALPYAISRSTLRGALSESGPSAPERQLLDNITKRVEHWNEMQPFYPDSGGLPRSLQSRTTEAILNALILATYDTPAGELSHATQAAFKNMWALQLKTGDHAGAFPWLNFHNEPWEADDSPYFGNALAAIAVGTAPASYRSASDVRSSLDSLKLYLRREFDRQTEINRVFALWASARIPDVLTAAQKKSFTEEIFTKQQQDGGWSLSSLMGTWKRRDGTALPKNSDGYATGLIMFALQEAGISKSRAEVTKGLDWLTHNQNKKEGFWQAYSPNLERDPVSDAGRFMSDAATAYAVLALTHK